MSRQHINQPKNASALPKAKISANAQYSLPPTNETQGWFGNRAVNLLQKEQPGKKGKPKLTGQSQELEIAQKLVNYGQKPLKLQAKMEIGAVGDRYEQEADRVSNEVVSRLNTSERPMVQGGTKQDSYRHKLQKKPLIQRVNNGGMAASPDVEAGIQRAKGSGQPLSDSIREPMGQAMGADFSGVRVHTDAQSDQLNRSIQAKAFTTGQDVFFRLGAYEPGSRGGQELIAHELTHVVQQGGVGALPTHQDIPQSMIVVSSRVPQSTNHRRTIQRYPQDTAVLREIARNLSTPRDVLAFGATNRATRMALDEDPSLLREARKQLALEKLDRFILNYTRLVYEQCGDPGLAEFNRIIQNLHEALSVPTIQLNHVPITTAIQMMTIFIDTSLRPARMGILRMLRGDPLSRMNTDWRGIVPLIHSFLA
ncbi:DUF4157 domain-containing protein [Nostoc parmelioides]|uniref:DUF4157 domain-containing protein n=1 Tax=Nostoc parmelioides FACHB-3921 TaxID=2692909 RepID=A0ABR8BGZ9_9NOSO|nr:DUF4157 domain-containing protein [Nostoc parmelioides]MBD2253377.1 DUF4157 domain-containing protein [Nostoc parmelioides FACHB-3921]